MRGAAKARGSDAVAMQCACGAVGHVLPADAGYERDIQESLVEWRGGNIGTRRVAVELLSASGSICPGCQPRHCAYVNLPLE